MAQHDYNLANAAGAAFRSDLNDALSAILSVNSGSSAPSTTVAGMLWYDTTNGVLKRRNAANSGWLVVLPAASTMTVAKSANYTALLADHGVLLDCTGTWTLSLTAAATLGDAWMLLVRNSGTGVITVDPNSTEQIDGATTIALNPGDSCWIVGNGTSFRTIGRGLSAAGGTLQGAVNEAKGADIASATTTDIGAATGNYVRVTGTTTITGLGTVQAGTRRTVQFAGALTLTHNGTSLILPTGASITTAAGDVAWFVSEGSGNWRCTAYMRADGTALAGGISAASQAQQESASATNVYVCPGRQQFHPSAMKAWAKVTNAGTPTLSQSYNVGSLTDNGTGDTTVTFSTAFSGTTYRYGGSARYDGNNGISVMQSNATGPATGSCRMVTARGGGAPTDVDFSVDFAGDQ
jgi:hypothetical protein